MLLGNSEQAFRIENQITNQKKSIRNEELSLGTRDIMIDVAGIPKIMYRVDCGYKNNRFQKLDVSIKIKIKME